MEKNILMTRDELTLDANLDIIIYLVTKFNNNTDSYEFQDLLQVAYLGALKAIRNYDNEVGPLKNYVFSCVRNHLLRFLKKERKWADFIKLEPNISPDCNDDHFLLEFENIIKCNTKLLPLEKNILEMRIRDFSRKDICENLSLTKSQSYDFLYSALGKIKRYET